jgi:hypothetical protein
MAVEQCACAGVDPQVEHLVVDVLGDEAHLGDGVALDDGEGVVAHLVHLVPVLPERQIAGLVDGELQDVERADEAAAVQPHADVEGARAADDRVVDVEERADLPTRPHGRVGPCGGRTHPVRVPRLSGHPGPRCLRLSL